MTDETKSLIKDGVVGAIVGAVEIIPGVSIFTNAYSCIMEGKDKKELDEWKYCIEQRLTSLEQDRQSKLNGDKSFDSMLFKASEIALGSNIEKKNYLANGLRYVAENKISDDLWEMLLNLFKKYTVSHFKVLHFIANYKVSHKDNYVIQEDYESKKKEYLKDNGISEAADEKIMSDFYSDGIVCNPSDHWYQSSNGKITMFLDISEIGFLFIKVYEI